MSFQTLISSICAFLFSLFFSLHVYGDELVNLGSPFLNYKQLAGIDVSKVSTILQDSRGFIWLATTEGLYRFDGQNMTLFPGMEQFSSPYLEFIVEGEDGRIWIATHNKGLAFFDTKLSRLNFMPLSKYLPQTWRDLENFPPIGGLKVSGGDLYIAIKDRILVIDEKSFTLIKDIPVPVGEANLITTLYVTSHNDIWAASYHGTGPMRYDGERWHQYQHDNNDEQTVSSTMVFTVFEDSKHRIWLGTYAGLDLYEPQTQQFTRFAAHDVQLKENLINNMVTSIVEDEQGSLWLGFYERGLYKFDPTNKIFFHYPSINKIEKTHLSNRLPTYDNSVFIDQQQTIWTLTREGIGQLTQQSRQFKQWGSLTGEECTSTTLYESKHGLFFACENKLFLKQGKQFSLIKTFASKENSAKIVVTSVVDGNDDDVWFATSGDGIYKINLVNLEEKHYQFSSSLKNELAVNMIWYINYDRQSQLYALMGQHPSQEGGAILIYDETADAFNIMSTGFKTTYFVDADDNRLLIDRAYTTEKQNLLWFDTQNKTLEPLAINTGDVIAIIRWQNSVWASTEESGVIRIDLKSGAIKKIDTGLTTKVHGFYLYQNKLYVASKNNLYQMAASNKTGTQISCITCSLHLKTPELNHLQYGQLYESYSFLTTSGELYVFNKNSLIDVPIEKIIPSSVGRNLKITEFKAMGKRVSPNEENKHARLSESIERAKVVTIFPGTTLLSFKFSEPSAIEPQKIQYAYQLDGLSNDWIITDKGKGEAIFSLLPAGDYRLNIRSTNETGQWLSNDISIRLKVLAPWYQSIYAYVLYLVAAMLFLFSLSWLYYRKKLAEKDKVNTLALTAAKERVFANISHEFRIPLTLILGPADVIKKQAKQEIVANNVELIERNAHRLLGMVDQLLQLAKLKEHHNEKATQQHVKTICHSTVSMLTPLATDKSIKLQVSICVEDNAWLMGPTGVLETILNNLLSNAFKFTHAGGKVVLEVKQHNQQLLLHIKDNGCGIPTEELDNIFERFTRVENSTANTPGSGIGLALVKELVNSVNGDITVESTLGEGTKFMLKLPILVQPHEASLSHRENESIVPVTRQSPSLCDYTSTYLEPDNVDDFNINNDKLLILLVDDNPDIRKFLKDSLLDEYHIVEAKDGKQGLERALKYSPDLIISDIMMPEMNGFELLSQIRENMAICHIPIILLTAKGDDESKLKGLSDLADDYITKPFNPEQLHVRIKSLLGLREIIRKKLDKQFSASKGKNSKATNEGSKKVGPSLTEKDHQFIEKLQSLYQQLHTDSTLNLSMVADKLTMSERQLQRKLKVLLGATFSESLRDHRLTQAKHLLMQGEQVAVIADKVGFNSSSYFVRCFKAKYEVTPNEFRKTN